MLYVEMVPNPMERVSVERCEHCKKDLASFPWRHYLSGSIPEGLMALSNDSLSVGEAHESACPSPNRIPENELVYFSTDADFIY